MIQQTATPATAELRARADDLHRLAGQARGDVASLAYRITRAAEDVAQYATIREPVEYTTTAVVQACTVMSWHLRLTGTIAMDRPSHGGRTPRQHIVHALTTIATHLEIGVRALADIHADAASTSALGAAGQYSQGWAPSCPVSSTPPPQPVAEPAAEPLATGLLLVLAALIALLLVGVLTRYGGTTHGMPAHPTTTIAEVR